MGHSHRKLFVCQYKVSSSTRDGLGKFYDKGIPVPAQLQAIRKSHLRYVYDLSKKGVLWAGGPWADFTGGLNVFAVNSLEEAKKAQENDPYYVNGLFYGAKYFEWVLHAPLSKVAPAHRERLIQSYRELGILPESV